MGKCVEKLPHFTDKCSSRDGLQVFAQEDGTFNGYCYSCGAFVPDPYQDKPEGYKPTFVTKTKEQIQQELEEIDGYRVVDLADRKLRASTLEYFGVKVGVSEQDGETPTLHYYPYTANSSVVGYKVRLVSPKRLWSVGNQRDVDLFGWEQAKKTGGKKLFITEGEIDAMSLFQIMKDKNKGTQYADSNPAVVSLAHGAAAAMRDLARSVKDIREFFKEIVLVFDQDDAGRAAATAVMRVIPDALVTTLPFKDVNEGLQKGHGNQVYASVVFNAKKPKNTRFVNANDLHESSKEPAQYGVSWPWKHITEATRGIRLGETIYIGAGQKQGKSEVVNTLTAHFIKEHGWKVFLVKPEESNKKTYKLVAGKLTGKFFHDPNKPFDGEAYDQAGEVMRDHLFMLDLYQHVGWETLKADIREAAMEGCKAIIIDPITNLTNGMDAASANVKLQEIAQELSAMALDLNVVIFIFCHLRNPDSGPPHERGGEVLSSQFAGSRAMARSCNLMLGLEGNRDPNLSAEERNVRTLVLLEDREFGQVGRFGLYWDSATGLFNEM